MAPVPAANSVVIVNDQNNQNRVFASAGTNFYRSVDGGISWTSLSDVSGGFNSAIIDVLSPNVVYATLESGLYKSTTGGDSWSHKITTTGSQFIFRVAQDNNGYLYTSVRNPPGGVWRSTDGAETWENVGDPAWGTRNTWGLDAKGGRVIVSVEGLGIYIANADGTPIGPNPVVFLPGFAGSWSYNGLMENQPTTYSDWQLLPILSDTYYQPLLQTLKNAGLSDSGPNQNLFTFAYDFRRSIADTAASLNTYLTNAVAPKNPEKKADIVAHSMGGLVARYCFEKISGCSAKINKIITAGSPHQGVLEAYKLWEGGVISETNLFLRAIEEIALHASGLPYILDKDIIQNRFPGVRDLLPVFDYIQGKPYSSLSSLTKNPTLETLTPFSSQFTANTTAFSGNALATAAVYTVLPANTAEQILGLWADGKPISTTSSIGDGTVLKTSSEVGGAANNYYSLEHKDYLRTQDSLSAILSTLGLSGSIATNNESITSLLIFILHSPATLNIFDQNNNPVGITIDNKAVFIKNPSLQNYQAILTGTGQGQYTLDSFHISLANPPVKKSLSGTIQNGQVQNLTFQFTGDSQQNFQDQTGDTFLQNFRQKIAALNKRQTRLLENQVLLAVRDLRANKKRPAALKNLEKAYLDLVKILSGETDAQQRQNLISTAESFLELTNLMNSIYGQPVDNTTTSRDLNRTQSAINRLSSKASLTTRQALNLTLAQNWSSLAASYSAANSQYKARLLANAATFLLQ